MTAEQATRELRALIVIPTFNNRVSLRGVVQRALATGLPVLVVNDGSTDGIDEVLAGLACERIDHAKNRGKGAAIATGAHWAANRHFTHIITIDADGQHDPEDANKFIEALRAEPWSVIVGARDFGDQEIPFSSRFGRGFSNFWLRLDAGVKLPDSQSGFRAYPVEVILELSCLNSRRYAFEVEILVHAARAGLKLSSVPVNVHYPAARVSHFRPLLDNILISEVYARSFMRNFLPWPYRIIQSPYGPPDQSVSRRPFHVLKRLITESSTPPKMAISAMLGVFMGTLPLIACHTMAIMFFAGRLRLNRLMAINASHICAPPFVPALAIEIGYYMRHGRFLTELSIQTLGHEAPQRLWEYLIGSLVIGPPLAIVAGAITYGAAHAWQHRKTMRAVDAGQPRDYGGHFGHAIFRFIIRVFGVAPAYVLLAFVIPYYALIRSSARRSAQPFLKRRFPHDKALRRYARTVAHFYRFGQVLIDQAAVGILRPDRCRIDFPGDERMRAMTRDGRGMVLVTTHFGCWLAAMASMGELGAPVNFQFRREDSKRGRLFFEFNGEESRIRFVDPDQFLGGAVELAQALARGEIVSVMGDRVNRGRAGQARFLGEIAKFPLIGYQLARTSGARVVVLLARRTGRLAWRIDCDCISDGLDLDAMERDAAMQALLDRYVALLERAVADEPYLWFNFFDFWNTERKDEADGA